MSAFFVCAGCGLHIEIEHWCKGRIEAEERRLELNVVSAAIFAVKNRGKSAAYDGLRDRVAELMTFRLTVRRTP